MADIDIGLRAIGQLLPGQLAAPFVPAAQCIALGVLWWVFAPLARDVTQARFDARLRQLAQPETRREEFMSLPLSFSTNMRWHSSARSWT